MSRHERRLSQIDAINEMPLYPTEQVHVNTTVILLPECSVLVRDVLDVFIYGGGEGTALIKNCLSSNMCK